MISFTYGEVCYLLGVLDELQARHPEEDLSDLDQEIKDASEILSSAIALQYNPDVPVEVE